MTLRNLILIGFLAAYLLWYAGTWTYNDLYKKPRETLTAQITTLSQQIDGGIINRDAMQTFYGQYYPLYLRSLPPAPNDARQYTFLLLEMLQASGLQNSDVRENPPTRTPFGANYRFHVQCTGTLAQFSLFLYEFYYAFALHRIATLTLTPIEGDEEKLTFTMTINALALDSTTNPYREQVGNHLPTSWGWFFPRLASNNLAVYQVIEERNLLQAAKGGLDRADYTVLTGLPQVGYQKEVWFSILTTDEPPIRMKLGDTIRSGSFSGKIVEIHEQDIVLERDGVRWLMTTNENLNQAFALPPETAVRP